MTMGNEPWKAERAAMTAMGRIWTGAVAYVALAIGAGLSITFNVVNTVDKRGPDLDQWDIVIAVAGPAIVVFMVEMFVSTLWSGHPASQAVRWLSTAFIGGVAMRASWTHGHAFLLARGQEEDVATMFPLAIDLLAIMATALILSGRLAKAPELPRMATAGTPPLASGQDCEVASGQTTPPPAVGQDCELATADTQPLATGHCDWPTSDDVANDPPEEFDHLPEDEAAGVGDEAERWLANRFTPPAHPEVKATKTAPPRGRVDVAEAVPIIRMGLELGKGKVEVDLIVADWFSCSPRTARRTREQAGLS